MGTVEPLEKPTKGDPGYALSSSSEHEHDRLARQADMYAPFTRRLHAYAGPVGRIAFWPTVMGAYATKPSRAT